MRGGGLPKTLGECGILHDGNHSIRVSVHVDCSSNRPNKSLIPIELEEELSVFWRQRDGGEDSTQPRRKHELIVIVLEVELTCAGA